MKKISKRDNSLDMIRGVAVLLMLFAHSIVFFNYNQDPLLRVIGQFGDIVVFTTFLFVSGAVSYLAYISVSDESDKWQKKRRNIITRNFKLIGIYYLVALVASFREFTSAEPLEIFRVLFEILLLIRVPAYSEFLIPFIIYGFLIIPFKNIYRRIIDKLIYTVFVGVLAFILASFLHTLAVPFPFSYYTSFLFGYADLTRFPVLHYLPVYLIGAYWGSVSIRLTKRAKFLRGMLIALFAGIVYILINFQTLFVDTTIYDKGIYFERWPPSASFLLVGLIFVFTIILSIELSQKIDRVGIIRGPLTFIGEQAFSFYLYHIIILYLYRYGPDQRIDNPVTVVLMFCLLLLACASLILLGKYIENRYNFNMPRITKTTKNILFILGFLIVTFSVVFIFTNGNRFKNFNIDSTIFGSGVEGVFTEESEPYWWDSSYSFYSPVTIENKSLNDTLDKNSVVSFNINHLNLVESGKSKEDASDLKLVYFKNSDFTAVNFSIVNANTPEATIYLELVDGIPALNSDDMYFLFYGNKKETLQNSTQPKDSVAADYEVRIEEEVAANITITQSRKWILKGKGLDQEKKTMTYEIVIDNIEATEDNVKVIIKGNEYATLIPEQIEDNKFLVTINSSDFEPGKYSVKTKIDNTNFESSTSRFIISYPLYVTWSIDYEGFDVEDKYLNSMSAIADKYGIPMTHLFNPRVFIASEISRERVEHLVNYVLLRESRNAEEIGLHMHMHLDMVAAAGLQPKKKPRWGGRVNGHDVLTTAYDYNEFYQLVDWAKTKFSEYGLPAPKTYRAGGWFMDLDNLRALADHGFTVDTSGRENVIWGINQQPSPWYLAKTTKPFQPSMTNQNSDFPEPTLSIWEFPNNGHDTTNETFETLKQAFDENYLGQPLSEPQTVSYMSHPHWFDIYDSPKMHELMKYIGKFKFESDWGPVLYVTHQQAYKTWKK